MEKRLFLLDGMALVYRAHFALISRPIYNSKGINTSALYIFTQTLLDIINNQKPTHLAIAFDTSAPTQRHQDFPEYKSQRQEMPEDLSAAIPHVFRMVQAFNIPILTCDGYEADDIIGTVVCRARQHGFTSHMVTPDKDFGQLVTDNVFIYRPSRMGDAAETYGVPEILAKWGIQKTEQVIDILALWGDTSDNIPGVPGIGEKTASKLITEFGSVENLLARTSELKGKLRENLESHRDLALLSKKLATITLDVPCEFELEALKVQPPNVPVLKELLAEFEFKTLTRRLFPDGETSSAPAVAAQTGQLGLEMDIPTTPPKPLKTRSDVPHKYQTLNTSEDIVRVLRELKQQPRLAFYLQAEGTDPKSATIKSVSFAARPHAAYCIPFDPAQPSPLSHIQELLDSEAIEKVGHDLKFALSVLRWQGVSVRGPLFDTQIAHTIVEPDMRHDKVQVASSLLDYQVGANGSDHESSAEAADLIFQFRSPLEARLKEQKQERVFYEVEMPLLPVLVDMEFEGIRVDAAALTDLSHLLSKQLRELEQKIYGVAGKEFNINSARQLGEVLFDTLKICEKPKKTKTGQYATDEQTLLSLASDHEIVTELLDYRMLTKLKSTYADALPTSIWSKTGRIHTTYNQLATATGRLNSINPNLQNIPIRSERGQEIRKAFVPRNEEFTLLSADYSQIELRIIAALGNERGLIEAFETGVDVHTATAAKVFGVSLNEVTAEMRRKAKMVNYGIAYGISEFGLAQRLAIPRAEAKTIIEEYFKKFSGVQKYMNDTIEFARERGYVETVTGRRRYLRDIRSRNATIRSSAERNAINAPIQGTAADMIKLAMVNIHRAFTARGFRSRMLLQVHDELVFDLHRAERDEASAIIIEKMKNALQLSVPVEVEVGTGANWLEAH
ncbi:MAG: DNA polymerase I [Limisphaerales bacterium]